MDVVNDSWLWAHALKCYEQLKVMVDVNYSRSWAQASKLWKAQGCSWYEWLQLISSGLSMLWVDQCCKWYEQLRILWAKASRWYEWFCVISSRMWMTWRNLGHEIRVVDTMNRLVLWLTWMAQVGELKALKAMNSWGFFLWYEWVKNSCAQGSRCYQ